MGSHGVGRIRGCIGIYLVSASGMIGYLHLNWQRINS